jgi:hypothetical protein
MFDEELILFGSILVNTENSWQPGEILAGRANVNEPHAPDLRILAEAPNGWERWAERKQAFSRPKWDHFYFAVPLADYSGQAIAQPVMLGEPVTDTVQ